MCVSLENMVEENRGGAGRERTVRGGGGREREREREEGGGFLKHSELVRSTFSTFRFSPLT